MNVDISLIAANKYRQPWNLDSDASLIDFTQMVFWSVIRTVKGFGSFPIDIIYFVIHLPVTTV